MTEIDDLPEELLVYILCFVSQYDDLNSCRLVSHRWFRSCLGVVKKRESLFCKALKSGVVEWNSLSASGNASDIMQRCSHSACIFDSYMYVFGGCVATNATFNDLWKFHLGTHEWTRILTTGTYPSPKAYATMVTWMNNLVLFGGWTLPPVYPNHRVLYNELHIYDIFASCWTQCHYKDSPPPTAGHTVTLHNDVMVVFGGLQKQEGLSASTNDIFCLNLKNECWFRPKVSQTKPPPRYGHSQIKLDDRHILIMAGCGGSNKLYSDVWLLTLPENPQSILEEWTWEVVAVGGLENVPSHVWYNNPACKVGDNVVILSTWNTQEASALVSGKKWQPHLVARNVRRQPSTPEVSINSLRGFFRKLPPREVSSLSDEGGGDGSGPSLPQPNPSIHPNASASRENVLVPHLLDITKAVSSKRVSWQTVALNRERNPPYVGVASPPCLLYTLVLGRGHLIMFGGIKNDSIEGQNGEKISNCVNIISAPSMSKFPFNYRI